MVGTGPSQSSQTLTEINLQKSQQSFGLNSFFRGDEEHAYDGKLSMKSIQQLQKKLIHPTLGQFVAISIAPNLSFARIATKKKVKQNHSEKCTTIVKDCIFVNNKKHQFLFEDFCFPSRANFAVLSSFSAC